MMPLAAAVLTLLSSLSVMASSTATGAVLESLTLTLIFADPARPSLSVAVMPRTCWSDLSWSSDWPLASNSFPVASSMAKRLL